VHVTDEQCERFAAGDLPAGGQRSVREHLGACPSCQRRLAAVEREQAAIARALRALDDPPPYVERDDVIRRAAVRRRLRPRLAAEVLAFAAAATAAAAMPGSPVRAWLERGAARPRAVAAGERPAQRPTPAAQPAAQAAGITVVPENDSFDLVLDPPPAAGRLRVTLAPTPDLSVRATEGAVEYAVLPAGVVVRVRGGTPTLDVRVPTSLARFRVRAGSRAVFEARGPAVVTPARRDPAGAYVVELAAQPR
jgi:hypothetical protein